MRHKTTSRLQAENIRSDGDPSLPAVTARSPGSLDVTRAHTEFQNRKYTLLSYEPRNEAVRSFLRHFATYALAVLVAETRSDFALREFHETANPTNATVTVLPASKASYRIPKYITGKFAEHLGWNINNGMCAQILRNPTFADYPFWTGQMTPDGLTKFHVDDNRINEELRRLATRFGWPDAELQSLIQDRNDGLACFWTRVGSRADVEVSPDTAPSGNRAQRVAVARSGCGVGQWTWLPLHRIRTYEFELFVRSPDLAALRVVMGSENTDRELASADVQNITPEWKKLRGTIRLPASHPVDRPVLFSVRAASPGQFVIAHAFLCPADHVKGADPDVVRLLKESRLPILRWPGGNFVSTYHWRDGVGPVELRPTIPNHAWGGVEPNLFGTHEFVEFCREVGCEPMICVNAGSGTPEEAAQWVEYCNGNTQTGMGKLRASHGHPEPYRVLHWEIGNELWGKWQYRWTTARGYVDRLKQFVKAMRSVDPAIRIYACGAPVFWGREWNETLVNGATGVFDSITDHPLIGGDVDPGTDPLDVYRDFMVVPEVLERKWAELRDTMRHAGIAEPRLAITELQVFARPGRQSDPGKPVLLNRQNLPDQDSITEAIYDVLIYHAAIRLGQFVELVTHSATVNHGGGLRKERERVFANPCHYAQSMFSSFSGAIPVAVKISSPVEKAACVLPDLRGVAAEYSFGIVDALAAQADDGAMLLSLVNRSSTRPVHVMVEFEGNEPGQQALLTSLRANQPWEGNTLESPHAIVPTTTHITVKNKRVEMDLAPYGVHVLRFAPTTR
ncbi:MAG: hypothetical protein N3G20_12510 [Verrucomicrobiae bacterium]|nr:hypothetical protein [Verrucomicrobiae bacterium]